MWISFSLKPAGVMFFIAHSVFFKFLGNEKFKENELL